MGPFIFRSADKSSQLALDGLSLCVHTTGCIMSLPKFPGNRAGVSAWSDQNSNCCKSLATIPANHVVGRPSPLFFLHYTSVNRDKTQCEGAAFINCIRLRSGLDRKPVGFGSGSVRIHSGSGQVWKSGPSRNQLTSTSVFSSPAWFCEQEDQWDSLFLFLCEFPLVEDRVACDPLSPVSRGVWTRPNETLHSTGCTLKWSGCVLWWNPAPLPLIFSSSVFASLSRKVRSYKATLKLRSDRLSAEPQSGYLCVSTVCYHRCDLVEHQTPVTLWLCCGCLWYFITMSLKWEFAKQNKGWKWFWIKRG